MDKELLPWTVNDLQHTFHRIDFPSYQREPDLWSLTEKQRLIDSLSRRFDIASLYFYRHEDGALDCVDGRQRIGAIMSFVEESDDSFAFRCLNEIYDNEQSQFLILDGLTYKEIKERDSSVDREFVSAIVDYPLTVVILSESSRSEEFNLQFTRLNLGTIINSGEKLHAMVGALREECFGRLGNHPFLKDTNIPTRRFAREQVAAQILAHVVSLGASQDFTRTRHYDLQRLFKQYTTIDAAGQELVDRAAMLFDLLEEPFRDSGLLRNRAITVSVFLLGWQQGVKTHEQARELAQFSRGFPPGVSNGRSIKDSMSIRNTDTSLISSGA